MIIFKTLRWKNFLSTGNTWTDINLMDSKSTLIVGQNGSGKSTMLDALSYGLFGKAHRKINKPQLVNTINNKDMLVEVTFTIGKNNFKIVRGMKPQIFEIWKNDSLLNQDANALEYQKVLEQNIIKLNHKSFHQIVVLGSSSFIPFMQLSAQHRRDVIEDLLDINVFSKMNVLLREKNSLLKDQLKDVEYQIELVTNKIETQKKYIRDIRTLTETNIAAKKKRIEDAQTEIDKLQEENNQLSTMVQQTSDPIQDKLNKLQEKKTALLQYAASFKQQMGAVAKDAKFYEDNETCPTCAQDISQELRSEKLSASREKARELQSASRRVVEESDAIESDIQRASDSLEQVREWNTTIHSNNQAISRLQNEVRDLESDIGGADVVDLTTANEDLQSLKEDQNSQSEQRFKYMEERSYNDVMIEMLKDTGIKTKVIKQYVPVINQLVNKYLQILDFFVHFNLDESFTETIRSRHRDAFSYESFSEGEKQRIDLSLLFTWRQIAKMKNSVATNLLVLDETFDSSLDHDGVDNLMKILNTLDDNTNTFVISHKGEILEGRFDSKIEFFKDKNFSKMKYGLQAA